MNYESGHTRNIAASNLRTETEFVRLSNVNAFIANMANNHMKKRDQHWTSDLLTHINNHFQPPKGSTQEKIYGFINMASINVITPQYNKGSCDGTNFISTSDAKQTPEQASTITSCSYEDAMSTEAFDSEDDHKEDNFCMESRKRKHADMDLSITESWIRTGTVIDMLCPAKLPRLEHYPETSLHGEDVSEIKMKLVPVTPCPKVKNIITEDATGIDRKKILYIKIKSASLADCLSPSQIKEHLSSFVQYEEMLGNTNDNICQFCSKEELLLAPVPIYCASCDSRIKQDVGYYRSKDEEATSHSFCTPCFRRSPGNYISIREDVILKSKLKKAKNDEERDDSWVQCDRCQRWQHRICGLYNDERDTEGKEEYICPRCLLKEIEDGRRVPLPNTAILGAKQLPRTNLSDHIEKRLFRRMKQEKEEMAKILGKKLENVPGAEGLVVRVVSSVDKELEVKKKFREILHGEDYPENFTYRSKAILLFQRLEGVDVCLFGMCVQEFGSECDGPNNRCVYISYLDSVKYLKPERNTASGESLRTFIYHEILIGYLEYCKKRGFATCYIWSCPLIKGEDYIFYCHPETQKTPKQDQLTQWYKSMIKKGAKDGVIVDQTNLHKEFFDPTKRGNKNITLARLPSFHGDYWTGAAESIIEELEEEEDKKDALVMQKLGETILPSKENFMIVRLQPMCTYCHEPILSGSRWFCNQCNKIQLCSRCFDAGKLISRSRMHTCHSGERNKLHEDVLSDVSRNTKDNDDIIVNKFFETRDDFLIKCQNSQYQFNTLGHAKYSSMMVLYHFKHNLVVQPTKRPQKQTGMTLKAALDALYHASKCNSVQCSHPNCRRIRQHLNHASTCSVKARKGCIRCQQAWRILKEHAQICTYANCRVPRCIDIRLDIANKQNPTES